MMRRFPALLSVLAGVIILSSLCVSQDDLNTNALQKKDRSETSPLVTNPAPPKIQLSFFGADFLQTGLIWPGTDGLGQIATLGSLRLWDNQVKWGQINTAPATYDWSLLDSWISMGQSQSLDMIYTFGDTPQYDGAIPNPPICVSPSAYGCSAPLDVNSDGPGTDAEFSAFVTALVTRYKGEIAYYELWNEPDCTCYFAGTQAQMVRMGSDAAAIIRSIDPAAKILSPSGHGWTMTTWFAGYIQAGGAANFDIVNMHMRGVNSTNVQPESFLTMYSNITTQVAKNKLNKLPIWDTEHGIRATDGLSDPDELAGYAARSVVLRAGVGLPRQYVYAWDDTAPIGLQANKAGTAWDVVAGWLIGHSISPCVAAGTIYTCTVDNGLIVWDTAQTCSKGSCTTSKYTYPVTYKFFTDLTGKKTRMLATTVGIGYKPIFLTAK